MLPSDTEFYVVQTFSNILGLKNQTDGTRFIYQKPKESSFCSLKPDGYYYQDGVTFILDAKRKGGKFTDQLKDYMRLEKNPNFVGLEYSITEFKCYIKGEFMVDEVQPKNAQYYVDKYFPKKATQPDIVSESAANLANMFRDANINKQMNVPFIGAVMLCLKLNKDFAKDLKTTTAGILGDIRNNLDWIIDDSAPVTKLEKRDILRIALNDPTLVRCKAHELTEIIAEIAHTYNFINVSNKLGHDTMNNFLKIFRKWNSVDAQEKGQVFTPDHIAQLMYKLINVDKNYDVILDPTCGSGTFLTNAMVNMLNETNENDKEKQKEIKEYRILGIEIDSFNATLAGINMMLHGDGSSQIYCADCFEKLKDLTYNKVLMNPPFAQNDSELKFVRITLDNMCKGNFKNTVGLCAAILPLSCVNGSKWIDERKKILKKHRLLKIIKLPNKLFWPSAGISTCITIWKAHDQQGHHLVEQYDFSNDGFKYYRHRGWINLNHEKKLNEFFCQKPTYKEITAENNWLQNKEIDYRMIKKSDFIKTKKDFFKAQLDLMLINPSKYEEVLKGGGKVVYDLSVGKDLEKSKWKFFTVKEILERVKIKSISSMINKLPQSEKGVIVVGNSAENNGITKNDGIFKQIDIRDKQYIHEPNCLSYGAKGGLFFYQSQQWLSTDHVHMFVNKKMNENSALFLCTVLNLLVQTKGGWSSGLESNILEEKIKLPADEIGQPNWKFMDTYIQPNKHSN